MNLSAGENGVCLYAKLLTNEHLHVLCYLAEIQKNGIGTPTARAHTHTGTFTEHKRAAIETGIYWIDIKKNEQTMQWYTGILKTKYVYVIPVLNKKE